MNLSTEMVDEVYTLFPEEDVAEVPHQTRERTFSFVSIPVFFDCLSDKKNSFVTFLPLLNFR